MESRQYRRTTCRNSTCLPKFAWKQAAPIRRRTQSRLRRSELRPTQFKEILTMRFTPHQTLLLAPMLVSMSGCSSGPPTYSPSASLENRAYFKFEYNSSYPISVGTVLVYQGATSCARHPPGSEQLFTRARGNPLIPDVNLEGTWLTAGKSTSFIARAVTSVTSQCMVAGTITPRSDVRYLIRLNQQTNTLCTLELFENESTVVSNDYTVQDCPR